MSTIELGKIAKVSWGNTSITKASYVSDGYTAFSATGPDGFLENYENSSEGIVLSAIGANCGKCFWAEGKWTAIKNTITITDIDDSIILPKILLYYLNLPSIWPRKGGGQPFISLADAKALNVHVPPVQEQRSILKQIELTTSLLEKRRQSIAKLDQLTQAIFMDMFGDPMTNPKGWPEKRMEEVSLKITDGEHQNPDFVQSGYPMVMAQHVLEAEVSLQNIKYVSNEDFEKFTKKCKPQKGDVLLVSRGATIGRNTVVNTADDFCLMGSVILIKTHKENTAGQYLSCLFKTNYFRSKLLTTSSASAQQAIYLKHLKELVIPVPAIHLQEEFSNKIEAINGSKRQMTHSLNILSELQQSLMDKYFGT